MVAAVNRSVLYVKKPDRPATSGSKRYSSRSNRVWRASIGKRLDAEAGVGQPAAAVVVEHRERGLEHRRAGHVAGHPQMGHEPVERGLLVVERVEDPLADAPDELGERRLPGQVGPQREDVGEQADDALQLGQGAAGHGGAEGEVVLVGVAEQQGLEGGEQRHVGGGPEAAAERGDGPAELLAVLHDVPGAAEGRLRRAGAVGGQVEWGYPGQLLLPEGEVARQALAAVAGPLPGRVVAVADRQRRLVAAGVGVQQILEEHVDGPAVGGDVVQDDGEDVLIVADADERGPQQRSGGQVERAGAELGDDRPHRRLAGLRVALQRHGGRVDDCGLRAAVGVGDEPGA
ncbi:hypothetical protein GCM10020218_052130 [Dactylosporangium vinaceum]